MRDIFTRNWDAVEMTEMLSLALDSVVMLGALRRFSEALSSRNSPQNNDFFR